MEGAANRTNAISSSLWETADLSYANSNFWEEVAHANNANDYDSNFSEVIKPEMNRYDKIRGQAPFTRAKDYSIWAKVGNVSANYGDIIPGNRDVNETAIPTDADFTYASWTGTADTGDYIEKNGVISGATKNTTTDPESVGK